MRSKLEPSYSPVSPGRGNAANPEPMNTERCGDRPSTRDSEKAVCTGSGSFAAPALD